MSQAHKSYLNPPLPDRKNLSFVAARPRALMAWEANLPKINYLETARLLYSALREINQLKTGPGERQALLDALAGSVQETADALFRHYLEQPLKPSELEHKVVALAQGLGIELATGYRSAGKAAADSSSGRNRKDISARALHHCLWSLLPNLKRCFAMYLPAPQGLWAELHELFRLAHKSGTEQQKFDWLGQETSLSQAYKAALLFDIAQPYQLQRYELAPLYAACLAWSPLARLRPASDPGTYMINLMSDRGPVSLSHKTSVTIGMLSLHTDELVQRLQQKGGLPKVNGISTRLQQHLASAWDRAQPRRFRRQPAEQKVDLVLGLSNVHSQLCQGSTFEAFLRPYRPEVQTKPREMLFEAKDTQDVQNQNDVWQHSFDAGDNRLPDIPGPEEDRPAQPETPMTMRVTEYQVKTLDMSPRGYRLLWSDQVPTSLVMGEVISLKPEGSEHWTIGVLRWLRQGQNGGVQLGVELLSPQGTACAARILSKTGHHTDFLRAISLPALKAIAQPESILLPRLKAQTGQKILLYRERTEQPFRLSQKLTETSAIGQFAIEQSAHTNANTATKNHTADPGHNPLWRSS